jgi:uncharacterized protein with von Willebrand factor type A (vWA) domain
MFFDFLYALRRHGVPVGTQEWVALHDALHQRLIEDVDSLYGLGRAICVHTEAHYDSYDMAFLEVFEGVDFPEIREALLEWLQNPIPLREISAEAFEQATGMSLEELIKKLEETLAKQKKRHDGGNRWVGTGGRSPFGHGGRHPAGIRVGGPGGSRSAVQIAAERRFRNYRTDVTIDVRQFKVALRELRHLGRDGPEELAIDPTIDRTCDNGGEIELVFEKERKNTVRLALLMDAGGSMDPYARLVDRLFSAASEIGHWKSFDHYFFHNCPYSRVYTSIERLESMPTAEVFRKHPPETKFVFVGDACMAPWELTAVGGVLSLWEKNQRSGLDWITHFKKTFKDSVWLNPEPERFWRHETIAAIGRVIPMFPLSLDGMRAAVRHLRKGSVHFPAWSA